MMVKLEALNEIISDLQAQVKPQATGHIRTRDFSTRNRAG